MKTINRLQLEKDLVLTRDNILEKIGKIFEGKAIEAHIMGSIARGMADAYSDLDIWLTFNDEDFEEIYKKRFEYLSLLGNILNVCEPPQNAPLGGVHSALLIKDNSNNILMVDVYLCPASSSFITKEGRKMFGIDLPIRELQFNPQKIKVDENYRINFFIGFIFNTIKKLARHNTHSLDGVLREYHYLYENYNISVDPLGNEDQNFDTLKKIIKNIQKVADGTQRNALVEIYDFAIKILV